MDGDWNLDMPFMGTGPKASKKTNETQKKTRTEKPHHTHDIPVVAGIKTFATNTAGS